MTDPSQATIQERLTPPLLTLPIPLSPPGLPSDLMELELTSTPEDLLAAEAAELDKRIIAKDEDMTDRKTPRARMKTEDGHSDELGSYLRTPADSSSSPLRRKSLQDLKASTPLLPHDAGLEVEEKPLTVSIPAEMHDMLPLPDSDTSILNPETASKHLDDFVQNTAAPSAKSVINKTLNEQLSELDTVLKLHLPTVEDLIKPSPPWHTYTHPDTLKSPLEQQRLLLSVTKSELLREEQPWPGVSKLERRLPWSPFPARLGRVGVEEVLDDGLAGRYLAELDYFGGGVDVRVLVAKCGWLRLLEGEEGDGNELEVGGFEEGVGGGGEVEVEEGIAPTPAKVVDVAREAAEASPLAAELSGRLDMRTLLRKRKLELEQASNRFEGAANKAQRIAVEHVAPLPPRDRMTELRATRFSDQRGQGLASFLQIQGREPERSTRTIEQPDAQDEPPSQAIKAPPGPHHEKTATPSHQQQRPRAPLPTPTILNPQTAHQVIISTSLLANTRPFIRRLHFLLPNLEIIERDTPILHSRHQPPSRAGNHTEADITLSPSTGLLLTTLQQLKQRALPGHTASFCGVRERVAEVEGRYERVFVLVAHDNTASLSLDHRDCAALCDLQAFATSLRSDVQVLYIPSSSSSSSEEGDGCGNGDRSEGGMELATWTAALISRYAMPATNECKLLQEETLWERLLRSAGMNAYAAQAVLGMLKRPSNFAIGESESSSTLGAREWGLEYGLAAFVGMSAGERVQRFGGVLGGEGVLGRVSKVVDGGWISVANG